MSSYLAIVTWRRGDQDFLDDNYSRGHEWTFDGGLTVAASASPDIVPLPMSVAENVDPEEAFVAKIDRKLPGRPARFRKTRINPP